LKECEDQFSRDKLTQIYEDYGYTYPDIHELIKKCFQGAKAKFGNQEFRDFMLTRILGDQKVAGLFGKHSYFEKAGMDEMIQVFYTVGFIGRRQSGSLCARGSAWKRPLRRSRTLNPSGLSQGALGLGIVLRIPVALPMPMGVPCRGVVWQFCRSLLPPRPSVEDHLTLF
jgi:hypothetical protein